MRKGVFLFLAATVFFAACSSNSSGNFQITLKDAPLEADSIRVVIAEVSVHRTGGGAWSVVSSQPRTVDLIQLAAHQERIVDVKLDKGSYTEIRFLITSGQIAVGGQTYDLSIPSSEIKIPVLFEVLADGTTDVLLDFVASDSIEAHSTGGGTEYILRPVITLVSVYY